MLVSVGCLWSGLFRREQLGQREPVPCARRHRLATYYGVVGGAVVLSTCLAVLETGDADQWRGLISVAGFEPTRWPADHARSRGEFGSSSALALLRAPLKGRGRQLRRPCFAGLVLTAMSAVRKPAMMSPAPGPSIMMTAPATLDEYDVIVCLCDGGYQRSEMHRGCG